MSVAVRIEASAFADERFVALARLAGLADADHARGKMARLWRQCTDHATYVLSVEIVESVLGANASDALVKSGLGAVHDDGIRICGTTGRIEWIEKLRKNGKKGGKAKAKHLPSNSVANEEKEKEKEKEVSPESLSATDALRNEIVSQQPGHKLARSWTASQRSAWARSFDAINARDGRSWSDIDRVIHWLFHEQVGDARFVVQSPDSLRDKWDRIEAVRRKPRPVESPRQQQLTQVRRIPDITPPKRGDQ